MTTNANFFERKIKPALLYIGTIGAALTAMAYIALVCILIFGFLAHNAVQTLVFAIINAVIGLLIMQMLKIQGQDFAKSIPENKAILDEYYATKTKDKKLHSIRYYWTKTLITDSLSKGLSILFTTIGIVYIVVSGSQDYTLFIMAFVNLVMFFCFGLISLSKTYDFFNNEHMAYVKEQLRLVKEQETSYVLDHNQQIPKETNAESGPPSERSLAQKVLEMAPPQLPQPPNDIANSVGGGPILEPAHSDRSDCSHQSVVLDSMECGMGCMGGDTARHTNPTLLYTDNTQNTNENKEN